MVSIPLTTLSLCNYLTFSVAWTKDPIVNGFIPQSGTNQLSSLIEFIGTIDNGKNHTTRWFRVAEKAGCGGAENTTAEASLECMRGKPWRALLTAIKPGGVTFSAGGLGKAGDTPLQ
jgi:cholinesterase